LNIHAYPKKENTIKAVANNFPEKRNNRKVLQARAPLQQRTHDLVGSVVQLQKRGVNQKCNLRDLLTKEVSIEINANTEVEIVTPVESSQFHISFLGPFHDVGPWHTKIKYNSKEYWIKNSHIGGSDDFKIILKKPVAKNPTPELKIITTEDSSMNKLGENPASKSASITIGKNTNEKSLKDNLGNYFTPKTAMVEEKNNLGMAGGGNLDYDQIKKPNYNPNSWIVNPIGGLLCNHNGEPITGGGAWVLSKEEILSGAQGTTQNAFYGGGDMDSHEKAGGTGSYWAGEMYVRDGKVKSINNQSGTYHFESEANVNILTYLLKNNILTKDQIDAKQLEIQAWTQTGMDREGSMQTWEGFRGRVSPEETELINDYQNNDLFGHNELADREGKLQPWRGLGGSVSPEDNELINNYPNTDSSEEYSDEIKFKKWNSTKGDSNQRTID
jgi:hypothetical protein